MDAVLGLISTCIIVAKGDALTEKSPPHRAVEDRDAAEQVERSGLTDDLDVDYSARPLCSYRAQVNINTASDKVLMRFSWGSSSSRGIPCPRAPRRICRPLSGPGNTPTRPANCMPTQSTGICFTSARCEAHSRFGQTVDARTAKALGRDRQNWPAYPPFFNSHSSFSAQSEVCGKRMNPIFISAFIAHNSKRIDSNSAEKRTVGSSQRSVSGFLTGENRCP